MQAMLQSTTHLSHRFPTIQRRHELLKLLLSLSCLRTNYTTPYEKPQHTKTTGRHVCRTDSQVKMALSSISTRPEKSVSRKTIIGGTEKTHGVMHMFFFFFAPRFKTWRISEFFSLRAFLLVQDSTLISIPNYPILLYELIIRSNTCNRLAKSVFIRPFQ